MSTMDVKSTSRINSSLLGPIVNEIDVGFKSCLDKIISELDGNISSRTRAYEAVKKEIIPTQDENKYEEARDLIEKNKAYYEEVFARIVFSFDQTQKTGDVSSIEKFRSLITKLKAELGKNDDLFEEQKNVLMGFFEKTLGKQLDRSNLNQLMNDFNSCRKSIRTTLETERKKQEELHAKASEVAEAFVVVSQGEKEAKDAYDNAIKIRAYFGDDLLIPIDKALGELIAKGSPALSGFQRTLTEVQTKIDSKPGLPEGPKQELKTFLKDTLVKLDGLTPKVTAQPNGHKETKALKTRKSFLFDGGQIFKGM